MDFTLTDEQAAIREVARDFAKKQIAPNVREWERTGHFPREVAEQMGELGFLGCCFPEEYGGSEAGFVSLVLVIEEIARVWQPAAGFFNPNGMTVPFTILNWGTKEQRERWVEPLIKGKLIGSFGLTEPEGGSDALGSMRSRATKVDGGWKLNGPKIFNSLAHVADLDLVFARTSDDGHRGISAFLVPLDTPGIEANPIEHSILGECIPTSEVSFADVELPDDALLGEVGQGFTIAMNALDYGRLTVPARCVGIAQGCVDVSLEYAKERVVFGNPIGTYQLIQGLITDMVVETDAARMLTYHSAWLKDCGKTATRESARSKYFAAEVAARVATKAFELFGGYAVADEYPVARMFTWAHLYRTGEGSANIQRMLVANDALGFKLADRHAIERSFGLASDIEPVGQWLNG